MVGIFDPFEIRGLRLPNRVLMAPMEKNLCTSDGVMTQRYIDYLVARARGGVGCCGLKPPMWIRSERAARFSAGPIPITSSPN